MRFQGKAWSSKVINCEKLPSDQIIFARQCTDRSVCNILKEYAQHGDKVFNLIYKQTHSSRSECSPLKAILGIQRREL